MLEVDTSLSDSLSFDTVGLRLTYFRWHSLSRSQPSVWCTVILIRPTTLDRCVKQPCLFHCWPFSRGLLNSTIFFFTNSKALSIFFLHIFFCFGLAFTYFCNLFWNYTENLRVKKMFLTISSKRIKML